MQIHSQTSNLINAEEKQDFRTEDFIVKPKFSNLATQILGEVAGQAEDFEQKTQILA
jgi:hypothetical protein